MTQIYQIETCLSTNDEILSLLSNDDSAAVFTFNQTNGRGQYGNLWSHVPNQNLAYSFAVRSSLITLSGNLLNYYTALIVRDFIAKLTIFEVKIKWPNDILLKSKKICGILIEKKKVGDDWYYVIGIGINLLQPSFENLPKAGSLLSVAGISVDLDTFIKEFHNNFCTSIFNKISDADVLSSFNEHLFKKDSVSVFVKNDVRQNGIVKLADNDGYLWIDLENDGLQRFFHKEIEMLY